MDAHVDAFVERVADRLACTRCVRDARLRAEAADAGFDATCGYCGRRATCVDVAWLADRVHALLQSAFARAAAMLDAPGPVHAIGSRDLVARTGRFEPTLAADVHAQLVALHRDEDDAALYGPGCDYLVPRADVVLDTWAAFAACEGGSNGRMAGGVPHADHAVHGVHAVHATRGLHAIQAPGDAARLDALKWAFAALDEIRTTKGRPVVRVLPAGTRLFVATLADDAADALAHGHANDLGSVAHPWMIAGSGPHACFALDADTAVAELRPTAGAIVQVVRARLARDGRLLDADALRKALARTSAFTADGWHARLRAAFVRGWRDALRRAPADPRDAWPRPLRFAADWLAHGPSPRLDGVVMRSGYGKGRKGVLFAAAVPALVAERRRRYEAGGIRFGYRRLDRSAEVARGLADADREQGDDADSGHDDDFHGGSSLKG